MDDFKIANFLSKETRKILEQKMPKAIRKRYKAGKKIVVRIHHDSDLKRWSPDHLDPNNDCILTITKNASILTNNLIERSSAFSYGNIRGACIQAKWAVDHFVYGDYWWDYTISYELG